MDLQQLWLWFEGSHGIESQHCMLCWSMVMADMQSANCKNSIAATASTRNVVFRAISSTLWALDAPGQERVQEFSSTTIARRFAIVDRGI